VRFAGSAGFELAMMSNHVVITPDVAELYPPPFYDPFTTLAWLAGITERIELGTTVTVLPYRNPVLTARMAATVDRISGGRFILGVGVGWSRQKYAAIGVPFERAGFNHRRVSRRHWELWTTEVAAWPVRRTLSRPARFARSEGMPLQLPATGRGPSTPMTSASCSWCQHSTDSQALYLILEVSMSTTSTARSRGIGTAAQSRPLLQGVAAGAAGATLVNAALWAGGRAADVSFLVSPPAGDPFQVGVVLVVLTTLLAFAVGSGLLALAARRSRRWVRAVLVAAALLAVVSAAGGPLPAADDLATGVLLAAMHLVTGAAFLVTVSRVGAR
jgi:hypothetical protein